MLHDVISAKYMNDYRIELTFDDGQSGMVDFLPIIQRGGIFKDLANIEFFKKFTVNEELGTLVWGDEIDIAPETLYSLATNSPLPDWMSDSKEMRETA